MVAEARDAMDVMEFITGIESALALLDAAESAHGESAVFRRLPPSSRKNPRARPQPVVGNA